VKTAEANTAESGDAIAEARIIGGGFSVVG
jgi:hypothetical protein